MKVTESSYLQIKSTYYTFEHKDKLTYAQYNQILEIFALLLYKAITENKEIIKLPKGLGNLYLRNFSLKPNARQVNYKHFNETGEIKLMKRNSLALDGYLRTTWDRRKTVASYLGVLSHYVKFIPNRGAKRRVMKSIKSLPSLVEYHK